MPGWRKSQEESRQYEIVMRKGRGRESESSVGIGRGKVCWGDRLLCRNVFSAKRGGRVVQGLLVQVQVVLCGALIYPC